MRIEITAGGIYGAQGEMPIGTVLDMDAEPTGWAGRYRVVSDGKGKTPVTNPAEGPVGPFTTKDDGKGWFGIYDAAGAKVGKGLREDDAKAFDSLSDEDKAEFATEHAKA